MVETGRVVLHMANSGGRESSVDLIGEAFALPCLCYCRRWLAAPRNAFRTAGLGCLPRHGARAADVSRTPSLRRRAPSEPRIGLHRRDFLGHQVQFKDSIAGQTLKQIMLHDPARAALFRKADASLDHWAEQVVSEEPARPGMSDKIFWLWPARQHPP